MFGFRIFPRRAPVLNSRRRRKARKRIEELHKACAPWANLEDMDHISTRKPNPITKPTKNDIKRIVPAAIRLAQDYEQHLDDTEKWIGRKDDGPIVKKMPVGGWAP